MPTDLPLACSLSAAEIPARLAEIGSIGHASLLGAATLDAHAELRFRADPETRARLQAIVADEAECCAFLTMRLLDESDAIALTIDAPEGSEPVMRELVAAFGARRSPA